jgi:hypothetical protein
VRTPLPAALLAVLVALAAAPADATIIAQFGFDEGDLFAIASSDADPTSLAGFGLNGPLGISGNGNPAPSLIVSLPQSTAGETFQSFTVSLTPNAGFELNLASVQFDASRLLEAKKLTEATFLAAVRTNLDGFASDVGTLSWLASPSTPDFVTLSIDLSAAMFQGLSQADLASVGGSLQLKFFFAMTSTPAIPGVNSLVDNVIVNGETVPEPAAALLLLPAIAALGRDHAARIRRRPTRSSVAAS